MKVESKKANVKKETKADDKTADKKESGFLAKCFLCCMRVSATGVLAGATGIDATCSFWKGVFSSGTTADEEVTKAMQRAGRNLDAIWK